MSLRRMNPAIAFKEAYNSPEALAAAKTSISQKFKAARAAVAQGMKNRVAGILKGRNVRAGTPGGQKMFFFIALILATLLGPFSPVGGGLLTVSMSITSLVFVGAFLLILLTLERYELIGMSHLIGIIIYIALNSIIIPFLNTSFMSGFLGGPEDAVFKITTVVFMGLAVMHFGGIVSGKFLAVVGILTVVALATPYMIGVASNTEQLTSQQDQLMQEAKGTLEKGRFMDNIMEYLESQFASGSGEDIETAVQEQTAEYVGIKIVDVFSLKDSYLAGEKITMYANFEGQVFQPTTVGLSCSANDYEGSLSKNSFDMYTHGATADSSPMLNERVKCTFDTLPKGAYTVRFFLHYSHNSSVELPLRIMSYEQSETYYESMVDEPSLTALQDIIGGVPVIKASSGPVIIHPATTKRDGQWTYIDPIVVWKEDVPEDPLVSLVFQLKKSAEDPDGEISTIKAVSFDLEKGLRIACEGLGDGEKLSYTEKDGRWISTVKQDNIISGLRENVFCEIYIEDQNSKEYIDYFLPSRAYSSSSLRINVNYDYSHKFVYPSLVVS